MLLIKNDPNYNESWPRAVVPYKRIYGIDEPRPLAAAGERRQPLDASARRHAVWPGRHVELLQARELSQRRGAGRQGHRDVCRRQRSLEGARRRSPATATACRSTGTIRGATPACTTTTKSTPSASWRWSRRPTASAAPNHGPAVPQPRQRAAADSRRNPAAQVRRRPAAARSRRQSRHQLPGQDSGRHGVHVSDARQAAAWC